MKRTIVTISKTGKRITGILGFITASFGVWGIYKAYSTKDIKGEWYVKFTVEKSAYKPYVGETHTQKVFFTQTDKVIKGDGEKWEYNGKYLPANMHRLLEYEGTIEGNDLTAKYVLHGQERDSKGIINVKISSDGNSLTGTFSGTAGESSGTVTGEKIN